MLFLSFFLFHISLRAQDNEDDDEGDDDHQINMLLSFFRPSNSTCRTLYERCEDQ